MPFFVSLLLANLLQAIGTLINGKWVTERTVHDGSLCRAQGGIKQAGNVAMALWWVRYRLRPLIVRLTLLTAWARQVLCTRLTRVHATLLSHGVVEDTVLRASRGGMGPSRPRGPSWPGGHSNPRAGPVLRAHRILVSRHDTNRPAILSNLIVSSAAHRTIYM